MLEVVIVGGGPAGLSAALVLGRCLRSVVLYDDHRPRNVRSRGVHGFLGHDGIAPAALRERGQAELAKYGVECRSASVVRATRTDVGFELVDSDDRVVRCRKLLLATGVVDVLPSIGGAKELYGRGLYPCPYCDGWEHRDQRLGAYGTEVSCVELALSLTTWSRDVILFTDAGDAPSASDRERLARHSIAVREEPILRLEGETSLRAVVLSGETRVGLDALFFHSGQRSRSALAEMLGCGLEDGGAVETFDKQRTDVDGLYSCGDASHDVKFAIVAAAHGARAAHDINQALREEDTR